MLSNVTAAVIAGGKSNRFGSPKQNALYSGRSLMDYAVKKAQRISEDAIIVGNVQRDFNQHPLPVINDIVENSGPLGGIYTALHFSSKKYVAVLPVDMPLLSISIYRFLYTSLRAENPVVAVSEKGVEPLVSIWPIRVLNYLKNQIDVKDFRLHHILKLLNAVEINVSIIPGYNPAWFENINFKKDLKHLEVYSTIFSPLTAGLEPLNR
jgi:molybdopterin-guanine dinucleotide biosynthesis protein A